MPAQILLFGHGVPMSDPVLAGLSVRDVTRLFRAPVPESRVAPLLEPFLDPYVRGFLLGFEAGAFQDAALIVVWRQGTGALHAFRYAQELQRQGLLPATPRLHLWNRTAGDNPAARAFDATEDAALAARVDHLPRGPVVDREGPLAVLDARQAAGLISGAMAFARRLKARATGLPVSTEPGPQTGGPRLALAGAPLGSDRVHRWMDAQGQLVLDLQGPDVPSRFPLERMLERRGVEALVWQVDPNDDFHGWNAPAMRARCDRLGIRFVDLGHIPAFPGFRDLPESLATGLPERLAEGLS